MEYGMYTPPKHLRMQTDNSSCLRNSQNLQLLGAELSLNLNEQAISLSHDLRWCEYSYKLIDSLVDSDESAIAGWVFEEYGGHSLQALKKCICTQLALRIYREYSFGEAQSRGVRIEVFFVKSSKLRAKLGSISRYGFRTVW